MNDMVTDFPSASSPTNSQHPQGGRGEGDRRARQHPHPQPRRATRPLTEAELNEVMDTALRVPGLGRMLLSLVRNRSARVVVPETALGSELIQIVSELDRLSRRAEVSLTRNLSAQKMQLKSAWDLQTVNFIQPLAQLAAQMAMQFDNHENPIARHVEIKRLVREMRHQERQEGSSGSGMGEEGAPQGHERGARRGPARERKAAPPVVEAAVQEGGEAP